MNISKILTIGCATAFFCTVPLGASYADDNSRSQNGCCSLTPEQELDHVSNNSINKKTGCCRLTPKATDAPQNTPKKNDKKSDDIDFDIDI